MLEKLFIKNYAIIDEISIVFDHQLNVITGETGAGKSIILGAISLILGERADSSVLINTSEKCIVEAQFDTQENSEFQQLMNKHQLDLEHPTIIRREINTSGKSRAFVNDTPVTLSILNELTACLVDLHKQFDNRALDDNRFMYQSLDAIAGQLTETRKFQQDFESVNQLKKQYHSLQTSQSQWQKEKDYNQFLFDELELASFKEEEIENLEGQIKQLAHTEQITVSLSEAQNTLEGGEQPIAQEIRKLAQQFQSIATYLPEAEQLSQRLNSCFEELKDIASESNLLLNKVELDPEKLQEMQERYDIGMRLLKKHGVLTTNELREIQENLASLLSKQQHVEEDLLALEKAIENQRINLEEKSSLLAKNRRKAAAPFAQEITQLLHLVGMPNAKFEIALENANDFNSFGKDTLEFLLDANKSGKLQQVQKAASGGELSRIMLAIKTLTAKALHMPTLIFDEVDTGISGEAAKQVGILLRSLGQYHQILCITHQAQVAGKGNAHLYVFKTNGAEKVTTQIKKLSTEERIQLIATMISGDPPSTAALDNARELIVE